MAHAKVNQALTHKSGQWVVGCGCGGVKPQDVVTPPEGSREVLVQRNGEFTGPVTGIKYNFVGTHIAIDVDAADAAKWLEDGFAILPRVGLKGNLTRV